MARVPIFVVESVATRVRFDAGAYCTAFVAERERDIMVDFDVLGGSQQARQFPRLYRYSVTDGGLHNPGWQLHVVEDGSLFSLSIRSCKSNECAYYLMCRVRFHLKTP